MTLRAVIVGFVGAMLLAGLGYVNDQVLHLESVTAGHLLPVLVLGVLLLAMAAVNPLLFRIRRKLAFRPPELAAALMFMFVACSIPGRGLMEQFTPSLAMPSHWNKVTIGFRRNNLMKYVPDSVLVCREYDPDVMDGFMRGLGQPGRWIDPRRVPWDRWSRPLGTWMPLVILSAVASICLGLVVHRQWSRRERLRYPIAEFTSSLIERRPGSALGGIFRSRAFWIGLAIVLGIRVVNGLYAWFPQRGIRIPMTFDFGAVGNKWPILWRAPWGGSWLYPTIYPIVIGFSFLLASEISLSLGMSQVLFVPIAVVLLGRGVNLGSSYMAGGATGWHRSGAYLAFAIMVVYVGRRYYWDLLKRALAFRRPAGVEGYEAWACRFLLASLVGMVVLISRMGLDWTLAVAFVFLMMLMFFGVSRIGAETGLFFIQPRWQPMGALLGMLGGFAFGPEGMIMVGLLCIVLCVDPSMALMPYFINAVKICDDQKVRPGRVGAGSIALYVAGVVLAVFVVLWANYSMGVDRGNWGYYRVSTMPFRHSLREVIELKNADELAASERLGPLERFSPANIRPKPLFLWAFGSGFVLVLLFSVLRIRLSWWPLHPVMFLVWATYPMACFFHSFLLGWFIKSVVTRFGGHRLYRKTKPFMIGAIAGDVLGALVFMVAGAIFYAVTGKIPVAYRYFPR